MATTRPRPPRAVARARRPASRRVAGVPPRQRAAAATAGRGAAGRAHGLSLAEYDALLQLANAAGSPAPDERPRGAGPAVAQRDHAARRPARGVRDGRALGVRDRRAWRRGGAHGRRAGPPAGRVADASRRRASATSSRPIADEDRSRRGAGRERHPRRPGPRRATLPRRVVHGGGRLTARPRLSRARAASPTPAGRHGSTRPALQSARPAPPLRRRACPRSSSTTRSTRGRPPQKIAAWIAADAARVPVRDQGPARRERPGAVSATRRSPCRGSPSRCPGSASGWGPCCSGSTPRSAATTSGSPRLLAAWPAAIPLVLEAQHPSWHVDETFAALRAAGAVLCTTDLTTSGGPARHPAHRSVPVPPAPPDRVRRRGARRVGGPDRAVPGRRAGRVRPVPARRGRRRARSTPRRSPRGSSGSAARAEGPAPAVSRRRAPASTPPGRTRRRRRSSSSMSWNRCGSWAGTKITSPGPTSRVSVPAVNRLRPAEDDVDLVLGVRLLAVDGARRRARTARPTGPGRGAARAHGPPACAA